MGVYVYTGFRVPGNALGLKEPNTTSLTVFYFYR